MEEIILNINGEALTVSVEKNWTLLYTLRDVLHLTGVKCGCSTGDCGACKVILDGKAVNSCLVLARNAAGKQIETVEGLSHGPVLHPLQQAFIDAGAVQCGYCTPGMLMSAKALLDQTPNPTDEEIRQCFSNNLCRCTGYVKIIKAVRLATERLSAHTPTVPCTGSGSVIGTDAPIRDAALKVTGRLKYTDDLFLPGMLYAKVLFSPVAHAEIESIDTSEAEALPGVRAVITWKNVPHVSFNSCGEEIDGVKTERIFDSRVRYVGDKVAAVAADTRQIAEKAIRLIHVSYKPLPFYLTPEDALSEDAVPIHKGGNIIEEVTQTAGSVSAGMKQADFIFEDDFKTPAIHHGAIETHTALADYDSSGRLTVYTPSQDVFGCRKNLSRIFELPMSLIRVIAPAIGGGFGGKIDMALEPIAAALSIRTGRPVKLTYTRREEIPSSRTRHAMSLHLKTGITKDGRILAQYLDVLVNAGAYAGATMSIVWAMSGKFFKNHLTPNLRFHAVPVYTNTPIAAAMRGFGSPQEFFAQQSQMNRIAHALGIDMIDLQLKNLVTPESKDQRDGTPHGNARPRDCVLKGAELFHYKEALAEQASSAHDKLRIGVGVAVAAHGNGVFGVKPDTTGVILKMNEDGSATLFTGVSDMGNGSVTTQVKMVSEVLGIPSKYIACIQADTDTTMWDLGNYSSRGTFVSGNAALKAANDVKRALLKEASGLLAREESDLMLKEQHVLSRSDPSCSASLADVMHYAKQVHQRDICCADTFASDALAVSYGAHFAKVSVNMESGEVKVLLYTAVHDAGRVLNPMNAEGQVEGAVQMGIGYALTEGLIFDENGKVKNASFRQYHMLNSMEMPEIRTAFLNLPEKSGPFGAKSIGECSVVPVAAAVANAVSNAIGIQICELPARPSAILKHIREASL